MDGAIVGLNTLEHLSSKDDLLKSLESSSLLLDNIEVALIEEVSSKADAFFSALSAIDSLNDQTAALSTASIDLSALLEEFSSKQKEEVTKLESLSQEQLVLSESERVIELIIDIVRSQTSIQAMLDTHSFQDALRLVSDKIHLIEDQLHGLDAIKSMVEELKEMKIALNKMLESDVMNI